MENFVCCRLILEDNEFYLIIINPENVKNVYKEQIFTIISCAKKNQNTLMICNL